MAKDRASLIDPSVAVEPVDSAAFGCESSPTGCDEEVRAGRKKIKKTAASNTTVVIRTNTTVTFLPERGTSVSSLKFTGPPR
jgi:hypothetical protein